MTRTTRRARTVALCLAFAAGTAAVVAQAPGQPPAAEKDKDKDKDKGKAAPATPDEQKALEAFQTGKLDEAVKLLQAAAKNNPAAPPAHLTLARWFVQAQKGREARLMLEQAAANDPAHPEVLLANASIALSEGRLTDGILSCEAALNAAGAGRFGPDDRKRFAREARLGLVAGLEGRNDPRSLEQARGHVQALLAEDPRNPQFQVKMAVLEFKLGQPAAAQGALAAAYGADPTLDPPELVMASLWLQKGDKEKAEAAFKDAVKNHGSAPPAPKTDAEKAKAAAAAKAQRAYADYLLTQGNKPAAAEYLNAAKKIEPDSRDTKFLDGMMARYNKNWPLAGTIFNDLNHQYPSFTPATANLALVLAESADAAQRKRAVELAQVAYQQNQRSIELAAIFGYCLFKDGRTDEAARVLSQVLAAAQAGTPLPTADTVYFVALGLEGKVKEEEAKKFFRRLLTEVLKAAKGGFVYRTEAEQLLAKIGGPLEPEKKDEKKEPEKK